MRASKTISAWALTFVSLAAPAAVHAAPPRSTMTVARTPPKPVPFVPFATNERAERERQALMLAANNVPKLLRENQIFVIERRAGAKATSPVSARYAYRYGNGAMHELGRGGTATAPYAAVFVSKGDEEEEECGDEEECEEVDPDLDVPAPPSGPDLSGSAPTPASNGSLIDLIVDWLASGLDTTPRPPSGIDLGITSLSLNGVNPSAPSFVPGTVAWSPIPSNPGNPAAGPFAPLGGLVVLIFHF